MHDFHTYWQEYGFNIMLMVVLWQVCVAAKGTEIARKLHFYLHYIR